MRNAMDAQEIAVGWWPGDGRYGRAAFYAYAHPAPPGFDRATLPGGRWDGSAGGVRPGLGRRSGPRRTPTRPRWSSPVRPSGTPVSCAGGTRRWRPAPTEPRRRSSSTPPFDDQDTLVATLLHIWTSALYEDTSTP